MAGRWRSNLAYDPTSVPEELDDGLRPDRSARQLPRPSNNNDPFRRYRIAKQFGRKGLERTLERQRWRKGVEEIAWNMPVPWLKLISAGMLIYDAYEIYSYFNQSIDPGSWNPGDPVPVDTSQADAHGGPRNWVAQGATNYNAAGFHVNGQFIPNGVNSPSVIAGFPGTPFTHDYLTYGSIATFRWFGSDETGWVETWSFDFSDPAGHQIEDVWIGPTTETYAGSYEIFTPGFYSPNIWRWMPGQATPYRVPHSDTLIDSQRTTWVDPTLRVFGGPLAGGDFNSNNRRKPPPARTRERKAKNAGPLIFRILDDISEGSEVIDALFDALPNKVKKEWSDRNPRRGLTDQAGQYGIDGADWKLVALWHNWHQLDVEQGLKNIVRNYVQDKVIGSVYRSLPKNVGHGVDGGTKAINDALDSWMTEIGL